MDERILSPYGRFIYKGSRRHIYFIKRKLMKPPKDLILTENSNGKEIVKKI
jgi:hypothetical protein